MVETDLVRRLGASQPFRYFVGWVPPGAKTCRGVIVEGRDRRAVLVDGYQLDRRTAKGNVPLPGSETCTRRLQEARDGIARGAASLATLIAGLDLR